MIDNRELAPIEQAMEILNRRAGSYNVVTISRIEGFLNEEILRQALDLIQCRHPRLNSRIVGDLDNLRFETEGTQKIPLRVENKLHNEEWQEVVLEEMNEKIDSSKVLLRSVLVRIESESSKNYLLTTIHHAITDGLSGIQLHSEILTYCQKIASGDRMTEVATLSALPLPDKLLPESMQGFRGKIKSVLFLLRLKFQMLWNKAETLGFEKVVPTELRRCGMVHRQLDEEFTQQLVNTCRQEKTTVQGALCAAMMFAAARKIADLQKRDVRLSCRSYVDLRRRLKPVISEENISILASSLTSFHILHPNTLLWELARNVTQQLEAGLKRDDIFSVVLMSKKIIESLLSRPNEVPVTVALTNVGRINIPRVYGPFELEEISYIAAQAAFGGVFGAAVTTFAGKMILNFMFSEPSLGRDTMESLVNNAILCLVEACNNKVVTLMT